MSNATIAILSIGIMLTCLAAVYLMLRGLYNMLERNMKKNVRN